MEHIDRHFAVSLHINHPNIDPDAITVALGMAPKRKHRVGDQRMTPKGELLEGRYVNSHWYHRFELSGVADLFPFLGELVSRFEAHHEFLNQVFASGGRSELFCGVFTESNWDEAIPHQLSGKLAALKIDLRLDVYPKESVKPNQSPEPTPTKTTAAAKERLLRP